MLADKSSPVLEILHPDYFPEAAKLAAKTMRNTQSYAEIYRGIPSRQSDNIGLDNESEEDKDWRCEQLQFLFEGFLCLKYGVDSSSPRGGFLPRFPPSMSEDSTNISANERELACSFMFTFSETPESSFWAKVKAGILQVPFRSGFAAFKRLLATDDWHKQYRNL